MDLLLQNQVAVVVGSARGIGRAIACEFQKEGAFVCWLDRNPSVLAAAEETNANSRIPSLALTVDVTNYEAICAAASQAQQHFGRIDHVVVSIGAGSGKFGFPFWNLHPNDWDEVVRVNLMGAVNVAHAFVPYLVDRRCGTICFLSSVAGQIGSQTDPPYSAAKAALINFAQCAAKDLASYNIRVNVISPGMIKTDLNRSVWSAWQDLSPDNRLSYDEWAEQKIKRVSPLGRWQQPEDIAAMAVFLASHRAANVTGQTLNVDGGQVMHA